MEEITLDLYNKYVPKYKLEILELERAMLKSTNRVSNLAEGVKKVMELCENLSKMWHLLPFKDKQIFQKLLFPDGILYSKKTGRCRTKKINSVFLYIAQLVRDVAKIKMGDSKLIFDIPHLVELRRIESNWFIEDLMKLKSIYYGQKRNSQGQQ